MEEIGPTESVIKEYSVEGLRVGVVERRSKSIDGWRKESEKIRFLEEKANIDLTIFSNIMKNHFLKSDSFYEEIKFDPECKVEKLKEKHSPIKNRNELKRNKEFTNSETDEEKENKFNSANTESVRHSCNEKFSIKHEKSQTKNDPFEISLFNVSAENLIENTINQICEKPSKTNVRKILNDLFLKIECENEKMILLLNELRKENDKLQRKLKESSAKELKQMVKIKQFERRLNELEIENCTLTEKLRETTVLGREKEAEALRLLLQRGRELEHLRIQKVTHRNGIEELKEKMAIDSMRRATLSCLNKEKLEIEMKKEELLFGIGSINCRDLSYEERVESLSFHSNELFIESDIRSTEETLRDY